MGNVEIITFNGCDTAQALIDELEAFNVDGSFELKVSVVPSAENAEEMGLYGSPTVVINGEEYQKVIGGNPGFY